MKKYSALVSMASLFAVAVSPALFAAKGDAPKASKIEMIAKYDVNKNGKLDADEIAQIKSDFLADPRGELKRLDADHDGKLSDTEVAALGGKKENAAEKKPGGKKKKNF